MGVSNNITTLYGWAKKGERSYAEQAGFATERVNIVAGYNSGTKELIAHLEHSGYMNKLLFNQWVGELLCPSLKPGQLVIMDNASVHKVTFDKGVDSKSWLYSHLPTGLFSGFKFY